MLFVYANRKIFYEDVSICFCFFHAYAASNNFKFGFAPASSGNT